MKRSKVILVSLALSILLFIVLTPDRKIKKYQRKSTKAIATELDVPPGIANFLVNTKVGRKISYAFIRKKVFEDTDPKESK